MMNRRWISLGSGNKFLAGLGRASDEELEPKPPIPQNESLGAGQP